MTKDFYEEHLSSDELRKIERTAKRIARETKDPSIMDLIRGIEQTHEKNRPKLMTFDELRTAIKMTSLKLTRSDEPITKKELNELVGPLFVELDRIEKKIEAYEKKRAKERPHPFSTNHRK